MPNTSINQTSTFESRLINSFGDGHNHELRQYESLKEVLGRTARSRGFGGILLGNVVCGSVSLDSLLLTRFGVFIIEFKDYSKVARIRINGQKEFQCLKADGTRVAKDDGAFLNVKGGCLESPYEQAKKNRIAVRDTLRQVFDDEDVRSLHVNVLILFNGTTAIEGIDQIPENERKWLSVINTSEIEGYFNYKLGSIGNGLDEEQCGKLINHIGAQRNLLTERDYYKEAQAFFQMGKYKEAYWQIARCAPENPDVIILKLRILFNANKNARAFNELAVQSLNNQNALVREWANVLIGLSFFNGYNRYPKDYRQAESYLSKSNSTVAQETIRKIREYFRETEEREKENEARRQMQLEINEFNSRCSSVNKDVAQDYNIAGRIVSTSLTLIWLFYTCAFMLPEWGLNWSVIAIASCVLSIGGLIWWVAENDDDAWFIRNRAPRYVDELPFRPATMDDHNRG